MAVSNYIQEVMKAAGGRNMSTAWFRNKIKELGDPTPSQLLRDGDVSATPFDGLLNMFFYDPKYKETLPYYDRFPLAIIVKPAKGGFLGMNLHYLPPILRAKFLDALMDNVTSKKSEDAKFQLTTKLLAGTSSLEYYKPCIKHYLTEHVKSKFAEVKAPEWEIATFLPTAQFEKATKQKIYADSRKKIS